MNGESLGTASKISQGEFDEIVHEHQSEHIPFCPGRVNAVNAPARIEAISHPPAARIEADWEANSARIEADFLPPFTV